MTPYAIADRAAALHALIRLDGPLDEATSALASFPWDWAGQPLAIIKRADVAAIMQRWSTKQLTARDVEEWANALECRDDVAYDPAEKDELVAVIFELANPMLHAANSLDEVSARFSR